MLRFELEPLCILYFPHLDHRLLLIEQERLAGLRAMGRGALRKRAKGLDIDEDTMNFWHVFDISLICFIFVVHFQLIMAFMG